MNQPERKIHDINHNKHIANNIAKHKPTSAAPSSLMQSIGVELKHKLAAAQSTIINELRPLVGNPFYSNEGFILYCGDCLDVLSSISTTNIKVDLCVTSPPYNIGKEYEINYPLEKYLTWCSQWMSLVYDCISPNGAFWLNLGYLEVEGQGMCVPIPYLIWDKSPFYLLQEVVWKYGAGVSAKRRLSPRNEKWLYYVKNPNDYTFNLDSIRDPNVKYPNQKKNGKYRCNPLGKNPSDVWEFPKVTTGTKRSSKERTDHPAQFPLKVIERIVKVSSNPLEIILDPFAGSCSTGITATGLGRCFIGVEKLEKYCKISVERFESVLEERKMLNEQKILL